METEQTCLFQSSHISLSFPHTRVCVSENQSHIPHQHTFPLLLALNAITTARWKSLIVWDETAILKFSMSLGKLICLLIANVLPKSIYKKNHYSKKIPHSWSQVSIQSRNLRIWRKTKTKHLPPKSQNLGSDWDHLSHITQYLTSQVVPLEVSEISCAAHYKNGYHSLAFSEHLYFSF